MISSFGVQLYTIREALGSAEEIRESFRKLKALGYDEVQTAGCKIPYDTFGQIAREEGLSICGTHDDFNRMLEDPKTAMELHRQLGTTFMGTGGQWYENNGAAVTEYIKKVNTVIDHIAPEGFTFTYHQHSHEFQKENGKTVFQRLVDEINPVGSSFVLDTYWLQHGGADVRHWLEKLAGRVEILHLKDMKRGAEGPEITEIGNGNLWWEGILRTAIDTGVKHFVVEQDTCPGDPFESLRQSMEYLKQFKD